MISITTIENATTSKSSTTTTIETEVEDSGFEYCSMLKMDTTMNSIVWNFPLSCLSNSISSISHLGCSFIDDNNQYKTNQHWDDLLHKCYSPPSPSLCTSTTNTSTSTTTTMLGVSNKSELSPLKRKRRVKEPILSCCEYGDDSECIQVESGTTSCKQLNEEDSFSETRQQPLIKKIKVNSKNTSDINSSSKIEEHTIHQ